jgi:hypothetical protein
MSGESVEKLKQAVPALHVPSTVTKASGKLRNVMTFVRREICDMLRGTTTLVNGNFHGELSKVVDDDTTTPGLHLEHWHLAVGLKTGKNAILLLDAPEVGDVIGLDAGFPVILDALESAGVLKTNKCTVEVLGPNKAATETIPANSMVEFILTIDATPPKDAGDAKAAKAA